MEQDILTKKLAEKRSKLISNVIYDIQISLKKKSKTYEGKCAIHLTLKKKSPIVLNTISKIQKVSVNGRVVLNFIKTKYTLTIPKKLVKKGNNTVSVYYKADYNHNGDGFHQFIDVDKKEYLYANFEPFDAHAMFPCFDQPDIKANFNLTVKAPKVWKVISNSNVLFSKPSIPTSRKSRDEKTVKFNQTPKISTYLFHLSAGDYHEFKSKYKSMPIRVYCRQSFKKYVPVKDFFKFTKQGLDFYQKFFDYKYPFEKYDQIVVPEFNSLAMENVGAVTFSEAQFPRRKMSYTDRSLFANVLLHEMTHMWFGDLVTMKWWNDLWLNESFADFLSYLAMTKATEFKTGWQDFYQRKNWAYYQDQLPTTHPIATSAKDTKDAFSSFDGISYAKGAAVLKQLLFYLGEENFKKGVQKYFKKHQWKNTELSDFLNSLENASGIKLKTWFSSWIKTSGVNTITPKYKTKNNKIFGFKINQSSKNKKLRSHKTKLGLFYDSHVLSLPITYKGKQTKIKSLNNKKIPMFLFSNYEDNDYVKVRFDPASLKYISVNFEKIKSDLTKQMILGSLWEMVRDAKLNPRILLSLILRTIEKEKTLRTLEQMISKTASLITNYVSEDDYYNYSEKLFKIAYKIFNNKKTSDEHKNPWFSALALSAPAIKDPSNFVKLLNSKLDQDKRWSILKVLAARGYKDIEKLIKKELKIDCTDEGKKAAGQVQSSMLKNKEKFWKIFTKKNKHSFDYIRNAMETFHWKIQKEKLKPYIDKFFKSSISIFNTKSEQYGRIYSACLFPTYHPTPKTIAKAKLFLSKNPKAPKLLKKAIIEKIDGLERVLRVRNKFP